MGHFYCIIHSEFGQVGFMLGRRGTGAGGFGRRLPNSSNLHQVCPKPVEQYLEVLARNGGGRLVISGSHKVIDAVKPFKCGMAKMAGFSF